MIGPFTGEYKFLSNFYSSYIIWNGNSYSTVEHAYQATKAENEHDRNFIQSTSTPFKAKRLGREIKMRKDFEDIKFKVMLDLLRIKFQIPHLKSKLLATGNEDLVELNNWGDKIWGVDNKTGKGQNHLGKLLMQVRNEIK